MRLTLAPMNPPAPKSKKSVSSVKAVSAMSSHSSPTPVSNWSRLLLWSMSGLVLVMGLMIFVDLENLLTPPMSQSCWYESPCEESALNAIEKELGILPLAEKLQEPYQKQNTLLSEIATLSNEVTLTEIRLADLQTSVSENAVEEGAEEPEELVSLREEYQNLQKNLQSLKSEEETLKAGMQAELALWKEKQIQAQSRYEKQMFTHANLSLALQLGFVLPLLLLSLAWVKRSQSQAKAILFDQLGKVFGLLSLISLLVWLVRVFPTEIIENILRFFQQAPWLRYLLYYGSLFVVIALLGGLAVWIQKRLFSPEKIRLRRLKNGHCPNCEFTVHREDNFCPACRIELMSPCKHCGEFKSPFLPFCNHCGK